MKRSKIFCLFAKKSQLKKILINLIKLNLIKAIHSFIIKKIFYKYYNTQMHTHLYILKVKIQKHMHTYKHTKKNTINADN